MRKDKTMIYLEQMETAYNNIEKSNKEIDNKSFTMIGIIGVMLTLPATVFPYQNIHPWFIKVLFIISIITYGIAITFFTTVVFARDFEIFPNSEGVKKEYEKDTPDDEFIAKCTGSYYRAAEYNNNIIRSKGKPLKRGFYSFFTGIITTIIMISLILLLWTLKRTKIKIRKKILKEEEISNTLMRETS